MARAVDEGDVALEPVFSAAALTLTGRIHLLLALVRPVACRARAFGVVALVDFGVCVAELDGDVALELVLEADRLHARDGLDDGALAVGDVADCADVDGGLARDDLGRQRVQCGEVDGARLGLFAGTGSAGVVQARRCVRKTYGRCGRSTGGGASRPFFSADLGFVSSISSCSEALSSSRWSWSLSDSMLSGCGRSSGGRGRRWRARVSMSGQRARRSCESPTSRLRLVGWAAKGRSAWA